MDIRFRVKPIEHRVSGHFLRGCIAVACLSFFMLGNAQHYDVNVTQVGTATDGHGISTPYGIDQDGNGIVTVGGQAEAYQGGSTPSCMGSVTFKFTYNDDGTGTPAPSDVLVRVSSFAGESVTQADPSNSYALDDGYGDAVTFDQTGGDDSYSSTIPEVNGNYGSGYVIKSSPGTEFEMTVNPLAIGGQYCSGVGVDLLVSSEIPALSFEGTMPGTSQEIIEGQELEFSPYRNNQPKFMAVRDCSLTVTGCRPVINYSFNPRGASSYTQLTSPYSLAGANGVAMWFTSMTGAGPRPSSGKAPANFSATYDIYPPPGGPYGQDQSLTLSGTVQVEGPTVPNWDDNAPTFHGDYGKLFVQTDPRDEHGNDSLLVQVAKDSNFNLKYLPGGQVGPAFTYGIYSPDYVSDPADVANSAGKAVGQFAWFQTFVDNSTWSDANGDVTPFFPPTTYFDLFVLYPGGGENEFPCTKQQPNFSFIDMPSIDLTGEVGAHSSLTNVNDATYFTLYLMYEPPSQENTGFGSAWVPVEEFTWCTLGGGLLQNGIWGPASNPPVGFPANYADTGTTLTPVPNIALPSWQDYYPH